MASPSKSDAKSQHADPRSAIVDALLRLAAQQRFEDISIRAICEEAKVGLVDFRDAFPSKGAILGGFSRRIDRIVLTRDASDLAGEPAKERLFDVLMRRLDAMAPYRDGLREVAAWLRRDPVSAIAINQVVVNSMRFMLEAASVELEGETSVIKLQGLALAWARVVNVWLDDDEKDLAKTMAALDRELLRGEKAVANLDRLDAFAAPIKAMARAAFAAPGRMAEEFRRRPRADRASHEDAS